jgi:hypothetical protein
MMYSQDGNVTESSIRHPTRLAGIGRWRPFEAGSSKPFFEKLAFPCRRSLQRG